MAQGRRKVNLTSTLTSTEVIIGGNQWKPWTRNPHKMGTLVICGRISVEFRFLCREACRFKSCHPHQTPERRFRGFLRMETLNPGIQGLRCRSGRCRADVHRTSGTLSSASISRNENSGVFAFDITD